MCWVCVCVFWGSEMGDGNEEHTEEDGGELEPHGVAVVGSIPEPDLQKTAMNMRYPGTVSSDGRVQHSPSQTDGDTASECTVNPPSTYGNHKTSTSASRGTPWCGTPNLPVRPR